MNEDQKRALLIGGVGIAGLVVISRLRSGGASRVPTQPTTGSVAPFVPQAPIPIPAGESIYDPNSQVLLSTPAPVTDANMPWVGSASQVPGLAELGAGTQATAPGAPSYVVNVQYPTPVRRVSHAKRATKRRPRTPPKPHRPPPHKAAKKAGKK